MVSGCTCTAGGVEHFRVGTGFEFIVKRIYSGMVSFLSGYCSELGAYYGPENLYPSPTTGIGLRGIYTAAGGIVNLQSASGDMIGTSTTWGQGNITISSCSFCDVTATVNGSGSVSVGGTDYSGKRKAGENISITLTPAKVGGTFTHRLKKLTVNGSTVTLTGYSGGAYTHTLTNLQYDASVVAYFVPVAYTVTCGTPSGGTVAFTKNGAAATVPFTAAVDDVITCTATPNADRMVQNFVVDGYVTSGGSTGPQTFSFTIYEREDDATYNCAVTFAERTAVSDSVVGKSDGATDDATVTCDGQTVTRTGGAFLAYIGNTYTATAATPTVFRTYDGWKNANGDVVGEDKAYTWTQGSTAVAITAGYTDKPLYTESLFVGTSTSDYGTGGSAYVAGCRAEITRPQGESKVVDDETKYLGGTRTVSVHGTASASAPLPTNWTFSGIYVSDRDASGGTRFYKANGASSVTFDCACNAYIYAIFANGAEVLPADVDQGNSSIATGVSASGLFRWEGGNGSMTMRWHSGRFVASKPMTLSAARVYADGYATGQSNDVKLKLLAFQSPDSTDANAVDSIAKSQSAFRLPMRRPEKYVEIEVAAPHQVTQVAVATGMEALWQ